MPFVISPILWFLWTKKERQTERQAKRQTAVRKTASQQSDSQPVVRQTDRQQAVSQSCRQTDRGKKDAHLIHLLSGFDLPSSRHQRGRSFSRRFGCIRSKLLLSDSSNIRFDDSFGRRLIQAVASTAADRVFVREADDVKEGRCQTV